MTDATRPLAIIRLGFILFEKIPKIGCVYIYEYTYIYICMSINHIARNCSLTFRFTLFLSVTIN